MQIQYREEQVIYLDALRRDDMSLIVKWRNESPEGTRTPYLLTEEMQMAWYADVVCNRDSLHRYWAVRQRRTFDEQKNAVRSGDDPGPRLIGISGLTNIQWENSRAEIALLIAPSRRGRGHGAVALLKTLHEGFDRMRLNYIHGETYLCNTSLPFWQKMAERYAYHIGNLPNRKFWDGCWHDSYYFDIRNCAPIEKGELK